MRTYLAPIGYDTRRVTRPVVQNGITGEDVVVLLRPDDESDTERAHQTIVDVRQLLHEIEQSAEIVVEKVPTDALDTTLVTCCDLIEAAAGDRVLSLGGGARDVLLPLLLAAIARRNLLDQVLFFSDLDHSVREWDLPNLTACPPARTRSTLNALVDVDDHLSLSDLAEASEKSKSTVVRHVNDLEELALVTSHAQGQTKRVELTLAGRLLAGTDAW